MDFKKLLPISLLTAGLLLSGCGQKGPVIPEEKEDGHHTIEVLNLEDLQKEWWSGSSRQLSIKIATDGTEGNVAAEIYEENLKIFSSNEGVLKADGLTLNAIGGGEATLSLKYYDTVKNVEFTIRQMPTVKELTGHEGTLEDPLDNEGAITLTKWQVENLGATDGVEYYIKGVVRSFYHAPGSRTDKTCSWFLEPAEAGGERFEIYKCTINGEDGKSRQWSYDDIWKGATAVAHGPLTYYKDGNQCETSAAVLDNVTGEKPGPAQTITDKTFAEVLALGKALDDGDSTYDKYVVEGYVVKNVGTDFYLNSEKKAASNNKDMIQLFGATEAQQAQLTKYAKVKVTMNVKNYHDQIENDGEFAVEVVEQGGSWIVPEHEVTVAQAIDAAKALDDGATSEDLYIVSGVIVAVTGAWTDQYKNITFTLGAAADATDTITVYRLKCTEAEAAKLVAGASVTVKGNLQNFVKDGVHTYELLNGEVMGAVELTADAVLTAANLLGYDGSANVPYADGEKVVTVSGAKFACDACGAYGDGIQMRYKQSGKTGTSVIYNKTPISNLGSLVLVWNDTKTLPTKTNNLKIEFATDAKFAEGSLVGEAVLVSFDAATKTVTVPAGATFFRVANNNQGTVYLASLTVTKAAA